jgi:hypothetical protein
MFQQPTPSSEASLLQQTLSSLPPVKPLTTEGVNSIEDLMSPESNNNISEDNYFPAHAGHSRAFKVWTKILLLVVIVVLVIAGATGYFAFVGTNQRPEIYNKIASHLPFNLPHDKESTSSSDSSSVRAKSSTGGISGRSGSSNGSTSSGLASSATYDNEDDNAGAQAGAGETGSIDTSKSITIMNKSNVTGLAQTKATILNDAGYSDVTPTNASNAETATINTIYYKSSSSMATVQDIANRLGITTLIKDPSISAGDIAIILVTG